MDFFSRLPAPLPLHIIQHLDKFEDLDALIRASPDAYCTVRSNGYIILDSVASTALTPELHNVLHSIARIRSQPVPRSLTTLESFRQTYAENCEDDERRPGPFPRDAEPHVYMSLVRSAANVRRLTALVLAELLHRTSKLRVKHAVHRNIDLAAGDMPQVPGADGSPIGEEVPAPHKRHPSWIECYRVQRAIWLLQLALDVRTHAPWLRWFARGTSNPASQPNRWPLNELKSWVHGPVDVHCVATTLQEVCVTKGIISQQGHSPPRMGFVSLERMPFYTGNRAVDCRLEDESKEDDVGVSWSQDRDAAKHSSDGRRIFTHLITSRPVQPISPIIHKVMESGLVIWDRRRLFGMGLMDEPEPIEQGVKWWKRSPPRISDEVRYAWCSIYYDDEDIK